MKRLFVLCAAALFSASSLSRTAQAETPSSDNVVLTSWTDDALRLPYVPKINMPEMHLPEMHMPNLSMPEMPRLSMPEMPHLSMPNMRLPKMPDFSMPSLPNMSMPRFQNTSLSNAMSMSWLRGDAGCSSDGRCCPSECCEPFAVWEHRDRIFGEFLYMTARGVDLPYATEVNGATQTAVPQNASLIGDNDFQPGFRVGGALALDCVSSISASFWNYESDTSAAGTLPGNGNFYRAELVHPNTQNVANDSLSADLAYAIDLKMADFEYKSVLCGDECHVINRVIGVRYASMDQDMTTNYRINGVTTVNSEIDFDGIGPRFGLEGEWLGSDGVYFFGNGHANLLLGEFRADYRQMNNFVIQQARAGFQDDRIVPQLELELGLGWRNKCGNLHLKAGYYITSFYNSVTTPGFIDSVQSGGTSSNVSDTMTFDGLKVGAEYRF